MRTVIPRAHRPNSSPALCLGKAEQDSSPLCPGSSRQRTLWLLARNTSKLLCVIFAFPSLFTPSVGPLAQIKHLSVLRSLILLPVSTQPEGDISFARSSRTTEAISILGLKSQELTLWGEGSWRGWSENQAQKCRLSPIFCQTGLTCMVPRCGRHARVPGFWKCEVLHTRIV